jgi:Ca2+-binding EF-hand superfamily protein
LDASLKAFAREVGHDERVVDVRKAWVDLGRFQSLFRAVQERIDTEESELFHKIVKNFNLIPEDQESWRFELVELWRMFHENDPTRGRYGSSTGILDEQQMLNVIRHSGYVQHIPRHMSRLMTVGNLLSKHLRLDRTMGFTNFLEVCKALREFGRERLRRIVEHEMKSTGKPGVIDRSEVKGVLIHAEVITAEDAETWEIQAEIEDCSLDGAGALSREDVVVLAQRIGMKMQVIQHETEKQYMESVGWTMDNMVEFRRAFDMFDDDMSDFLDEQELVRAMELLKGSYSQSAQETALIFMALGIDVNYHVQVDFLTFLRMIKMLEHSEARRSLGGKLGFDQDSVEKMSRLHQKLSHGRKFVESGVPTSRVEQVMRRSMGVYLSKAQLSEIMEKSSENKGSLHFPGFLKLMKSFETALRDNFQDCLEELLQSNGEGAQTGLDKEPDTQVAVKPASRRGSLEAHIA